MKILIYILDDTKYFNCNYNFKVKLIGCHCVIQLILINNDLIYNLFFPSNNFKENFYISYSIIFCHYFITKFRKNFIFLCRNLIIFPLFS